MWATVHILFASTFGDLRRAWRSLAATDLAYKLLAFSMLMPATTWLLFSLRAATSHRVVADVDIATFFLTTPAGIATLLVGASLITAVTVLESACLMAIGMGAAHGVSLNARGALQFGAAHTVDVLRLTAHMVLRVLAGAAPFLLAGLLVYIWLLREHDINFYLSRRPLSFWTAAALFASIGIGLGWLLARTIARWALALPLMLFENITPRHALRVSAARGAGSYGLILSALAAWAVAALALIAVTTWAGNFIGRLVAPQLAGSLPLLLAFVATFVLLGLMLTLAIGIVNVSIFSLLLMRLYLHVAAPPSPASVVRPYAATSFYRLSRGAVGGVVVVSIMAAVGIGLFVFLVNREAIPTLVIAHRGASSAAPENTLAAFRLAAEQRADFIELDVQESADGQVMVVHDSDLMKVGGSPLKIWDGDIATLRAIDIGSFKDRRFASERLPTLAEALAVCKGRCKVIVELKSYGHNQQLEQRVATIVEEAGMQDDCIYMSLDLDMVRRMKALRPSWRVGLLVAKAMGDLTELDADFLAVEARMATRQFIRRAHRAGRDVYIWTVNDPAWMFVALSRGVDGLITDKPDTARTVIELRAGMSDPQRLLVAVLVKLGATTEALAAQDALRP